MGRTSIASIMEHQLEVVKAAYANLQEYVRTLMATINSQAEIISSLRQSIHDLNTTVDSLKQALLEKGDDMEAIERRLKNMAKLLENKSEKAKVPSTSDNSAKSTESTKDTESTKGSEADENGTPAKSEKVWEKTNHGAKHNPHLELEVHEHDVYPDDPRFNQEHAEYIGSHDVVRYRLEPARVIKDVYHVKAYSQDDTVFAGKAPVAPIQGSNYDGSIIAGIGYLRYAKAMPVERIVSLFKDHGFDMDKSTANKLLKGSAALLEKLYECLKEEVLKDDYHAGDETYHKVLVNKKADNDKGSKKGYIWSILAMRGKLMYYFYDDGSRSGDVLLDEVDDHELSGAMQSDGFGIYKKLAEKYGLLKLSCFQHCRRKFYDLAGNHDADHIINLVSDIYHEEDKHVVGKDGWTSEDNLKWRREYSPPLMKELKDALDRIAADEEKYPPKSEMQTAVGYMLNEWPYLENIFTSGDYCLDNNAEERMQRYISMSRRNSLFFGSHEGAKRALIFYSLACSCKLQGKNFLAYLSDVLNKVALIPNGAKPEAYRHLLPDMWVEPENNIFSK